MSVLEFGAAETSYLPENLKLGRHVGVGLSDKLMDENPSITEKVMVDLNKVVVDGDVDSDELRKLMEEPFDAIIMSNTADFLMHPREVFKSAFLLLKPGGTCINAFSTNKAFGDKFGRAQTRMWTDYTDDQHMWVAGSFYQFSAGDGWQNVRGFDLSPESAKDNFTKGGPLQFLEQGKNNNIYAVQATKGLEDEEIDEADPAKSINSRMWMLPTMEDRDKKLVVPRLGRSYSLIKNPVRKDAISDNIQYLPKIYEALIKMDTFAFTFEMQSQLAADLVLDPDFNANDDQIKSLKEGTSTLSLDFRNAHKCKSIRLFCFRQSHEIVWSLSHFFFRTWITHSVAPILGTDRRTYVGNGYRRQDQSSFVPCTTIWKWQCGARSCPISVRIGIETNIRNDPSKMPGSFRI